MVRTENKERMDNISTKYIKQADSMVCAVDATCSFALLLWRQALGAFIKIVGGDQLCTFNGGKTVCWKTVYTCYGRIETI